MKLDWDLDFGSMGLKEDDDEEEEEEAKEEEEEEEEGGEEEREEDDEEDEEDAGLEPVGCHVSSWVRRASSFPAMELNFLLQKSAVIPPSFQS